MSSETHVSVAMITMRKRILVNRMEGVERLFETRDRKDKSKMKMPSVEYIKAVNKFGDEIKRLRGLSDGEIQELKFKINQYVESKEKK